ncbi:hypothetical protein MVEN_02314900 [Mycena venus]|uniref:Uncharacterized protein n=1 Tax=Mycena venus TaxID=2733690 RepID=A0A8H7CFJ3_9AGAR|nr:hypothetical protein MVEN_02314900 [Mycena venus]
MFADTSVFHHAQSMNAPSVLRCLLTPLCPFTQLDVSALSVASTMTFIETPAVHPQPHDVQDPLQAFIDFTFSGWNGIIIDIPPLSFNCHWQVSSLNTIALPDWMEFLATCIVFVSTAERSKQPITLVDSTIHLLQNRPDFGATITRLVQTAWSEFPSTGNRNKLIHQLVHIVIENVDSLCNM